MNCYAVTQCSTHNHVALCCYAMCRIKIPSEDNSYDIKLLLDIVGGDCECRIKSISFEVSLIMFPYLRFNYRYTIQQVDVGTSVSELMTG